MPTKGTAPCITQEASSWTEVLGAVRLPYQKESDMPENTPPPPSPATPKRGHHGPDFRLPRSIVRQVDIVCSGCAEPITRYTLASGSRFHRLRQYSDAAQRGRIPSEGVHDPETCIRDAERLQEAASMLNRTAE